MSAATSTEEIPERCIVCESWTQSHPVPRGWLCHTCLLEHDPETIREALPVPPRPDLAVDDVVECFACGHEHTLRDAHTPGYNHVGAIADGTPIDGFDAVVVVSCPRCTTATEYLTTEDAALDVVEELELAPGEVGA